MTADSHAQAAGPTRPGRSPLQRLYAATAALSETLADEAELVRRIARELASLVDARYAGAGILGEDGHLVAFETTGLTPEEEALLRPQPPHGRGILGALLQEGRPLRLDDLRRDPRSVGFPPGHPPMRTFLGVPLLVGGHVLGRLYATERRGGPDGAPSGAPFTDEDEALALGFAAAAAVALQSARQTGQLLGAERLRATAELAVGVAHDFNNLLATILGRVEVLLGQVRDPEQRESLAAIQRAARDGAATVARMREYGRPVDASAFRPVDLGALVREAVELTRPRWQDEAQRAGRTIAVRTDAGAGAGPGPGPPVLGDPVALREALVNLLFNAFDALPSGGTVSVGVAPRREPPPGTSGVAADWAELSVADTGTGMAEDVRRRAFEPFYTTKGAGGTGLGLAMVRKVVEAHGGQIDVETAPGRGTTFRLRFPPGAAPVGAGAASAARGAPGMEEVDLPPLRVVLVDDQADVLETTGMLLRRDGHDVRAFGDPRAALDAVRAERPDVLITDLGMPGLSGWDVARQARARWPDLPVLLLTGWGRDVSPAQLRARGVLLALAKPAELPALRAALARALPPAAAAAPLEILLVDDAAAFATVLGVLLGQGGHRVRRVERAAAAIEALAGEAPIDLVILDLNLPDRPSMDVLRAARARPHGPAVCVVSGSDPAAMERGAPGADLYVEKAYVPEQLERIYAAARARRAGQRARPV